MRIIITILRQMDLGGPAPGGRRDRGTTAGRRESQPYAELAQSLGLNESALKVAVHRLRKRYRELIRAEIASTLDHTEDVEAEMRHLFQVQAG